MLCQVIPAQNGERIVSVNSVSQFTLCIYGDRISHGASAFCWPLLGGCRIIDVSPSISQNKFVQRQVSPANHSCQSVASGRSRGSSPIKVLIGTNSFARSVQRFCLRRLRTWQYSAVTTICQWRIYNFCRPPVNIRYGLTVLIHNSGHFGPPLRPFWALARRGCRWLVTPLRYAAETNHNSFVNLSCVTLWAVLYTGGGGVLGTKQTPWVSHWRFWLASGIYFDWLVDWLSSHLPIQVT